MADQLGVDVKNGPAFAAAMAQIHRDLAAPKGPLEAAGRALLSEARAAAPKRTGRLAGSQRLTPGPKRLRITADTPYAAVIHWGWPAHGIRRQPWLVATWLRNRAPLDQMGKAVQSDIDKATAHL
jgi:hypothetical protein